MELGFLVGSDMPDTIHGGKMKRKVLAIMFVILSGLIFTPSPSAQEPRTAPVCDAIRASCEAYAQAVYDTCRANGWGWLACLNESDIAMSRCMSGSGCS